MRKHLASLLAATGLVGVAFAASLPAQPIQLEDALKGKTFAEKVELKSREIVKRNLTGTFQNAKYGVQVEVQSVAQIDGGIEVYAKAWRNDKQIGFGPNGTTDLERFRIFNPPVMVDDPNGTIDRSFTDERGRFFSRKLREDPAQAIRDTLAHAIHVAGQEGKQIVAGSVGHTTDVYYPSPGTTVDGRFASTTPALWATIRAAAGDFSNSVGASGNYYEFEDDSDNTNWRTMMRSGFVFPTAALPDTDVISSATASFFGTAKADAVGITPNVNVYSFSPASDSSLTGADYSTLGTTAFSTAITYTNWSTTAYNDFALNASGIAAISKTGNTKFGLRNQSYDADNSPPTISSNSINDDTYIQGYFSDQAGTSNDPSLTVIHAPAATRILPAIFMWRLPDTSRVRSLVYSPRHQATYLTECLHCRLSPRFSNASNRRLITSTAALPGQQNA